MSAQWLPVLVLQGLLQKKVAECAAYLLEASSVSWFALYLVPSLSCCSRWPVAHRD